MAKKKVKPTTLIITVLILLLAVQGLTIYLIYEKSNQSISALNQTEQKLDEKINLQNQDLQSKINTLTDSVTLSQESLQEELSELKATASADFSGIIESETKGVVTIKTDVSQVTGFLVSPYGYIITNEHVMNGASAAGVFTSDGEQHVVHKIGENRAMDLALLKITGNNFHAIDIGDSDDVKIGEKVIAIGNPLGLAFTATEGIISARDREGNNGLKIYFQIDVPLNPGNSGGPLINTKGEVIGVNNFKVSGAESLGFALEINAAVEAINQIALNNLNKTIIH